MTVDELRNAGFRHVGVNVKVHQRASLYCVENISLGNHVRIDDFAVVVATRPVAIGNYVSIHNFCYLGGSQGIVLEDFVTLAPGSKLFSASDDYLGEYLTGPVVPRELTGGRKGPVCLKKHVIIGAGSVVLPACTLGEGVAVGALSLVTDDLQPWGVYAGIPVRRLKERSQILLGLESSIVTEEFHGQ